MHEFGGTGEVSDVFCAVAVAGEDDRDVVFAAAAQDLAVVGSGVSSVAVGGEGGFVDFKDHSEFFCCDCKCLIICWKMRIIAMSEDFDAGMLHSVQVSTCIFFYRTTLIILRVHARDRVIQFVKKFIT